MAFSLFPRSVKFFDLFLDQHQNLQAAASRLAELFDDIENKTVICDDIAALEVKGNAMEREISKQLSATFLTPIDREDIFYINRYQESTLNLIKGVARRIGLYNFTEVRPAAKVLVHSLQTLIDLTGKMLERLRDAEDVAALADAAKQQVAQADLVLTIALGELYNVDPSHEGALLTVTMWAQVFDRLERAIEKAGHLVETIEGVALKNA
ncbi:MAG: DUF47 family protein [Candidatus Polarisedimenticolia bacterium]|nr:DUF47 family protein [bacterium]